jgi:hypothetical protein
MGLKETFRRAAGLLVELPPDTAPVQSAIPTGELDELMAELEGREPVRLSEGAVPISGEGPVEFGPVYQGAGLPVVGFTAEQMLELLASLPAELPLETRRQTVRVSLGALGKTVGATPETITADAARKRAALHAYVEQLETETEERVAGAQQEIASLEAQIEEKRRTIQEARVRLATVTRSCEAEAERLGDIPAFFDVDFPPAKLKRGTGG